MRTVFVASILVLLPLTQACAQANPKREACLKEAEAKGLYTTGSRNPGRFNEMNALQRQEFMKACMARR
jgi:hypothetical protein